MERNGNWGGAGDGADRTRPLFAKAAACSIVAAEEAGDSDQDAAPPIDLFAAADRAFLSERFADWQRYCGSPFVEIDPNRRTASIWLDGTVQRLRFEKPLDHGGDLVVRAILETEIARIDPREGRAGLAEAEWLAASVNLREPMLGALVVRRDGCGEGDGVEDGGHGGEPGWLLCDRMSVWMWQRNLPWTAAILKAAGKLQAIRAASLRRTLAASGGREGGSGMAVHQMSPSERAERIEAGMIDSIAARLSVWPFDAAEADRQLAELAEGFAAMGGRGQSGDGAAEGVLPLPPIAGEGSVQHLRVRVERCHRYPIGHGTLWRCHVPIAWLPQPLQRPLQDAIDHGVGSDRPELRQLLAQVAELDRLQLGLAEETADEAARPASLPGRPEADGIGAWSVDDEGLVRSFFAPAQLELGPVLSHLLVSQLSAALWARRRGAVRATGA